MPAKEAAAKFTLPVGFHATLFAGEPDVVQPIAFTFDDRGRMWVVECLMYPKWSQDGKGGKDRVVVLEDTDGDGRFDTKTVVIENGVNLSGIEWGFGGIYLCSSPNLIHVPITADDKPGKPEVLLDGWNIKDAKHNVFNSLIWGPDGWLYGCNGIQTKSYVGTPGTPKEKRQLFDCGVWKFHPTKKVFEVVANGTTNPFGLDFDEHGEMFITNCVIDHLFHVVPGGHYTRMYGNDPNPFVYGYMGSAVDYKHWGGGDWGSSRADQKTGAIKKEHSDAGGGHAHSGCAIYQGENFPAEYRNTLFTCNIHGNRLNNDGLERTATGMKGVRRPDFAFANDPWFRGICVKQGPEGALYVSDWCDTGECHNYQVADVSNGRIFRIGYGDVKAWKGDMSKYSTQDLVKGVTSKNEWLARKARRVLQERAAAGTGKADYDMLAEEYRTHHSPADRIRILCAVNAIGDSKAWIPHIWQDPEDEFRRVKTWAVRLAGDAAIWATAKDRAERWETVFGFYAQDPLNHRRIMADQLRRYAIDTKTRDSRWTDEVVKQIDVGFKYRLFDFDEGPEPDRDTTLMFWYAVDAAGLDMPRLVKVKAKQPILYEYLARKLISVADKPLLASDGVLNALPDLPTDECRSAASRGLLMSLRGVPNLTASESWKRADLRYANTASGDLRKQLDELGLMFNDAELIARFQASAGDAGHSADDRIRVISLLANRKTTGFEKTLLPLLTDPAVRGAALRGLANYNDPGTPKAILDAYVKFTAEEKADAVQTLASRPAYATALLDAVEKGGIPKADLTAFTARQIAALKDKAVVEKLEKVWGKVQPASAVRAEQMTKYKALLTPDTLKSANALNGKAVFTKNCATCHKMHGEGQNVGPELTGSQRSNLDYILENVVDPSAVVANEYKVTNFYLADGRIVAGIVKGETAHAVTVRTVNEEVMIPKKEIDDRKPTPLSVMPEGLFDAMKPEDVRDLVAFLMAKEPPK